MLPGIHCWGYLMGTFSCSQVSFENKAPVDEIYGAQTSNELQSFA